MEGSLSLCLERRASLKNANYVIHITTELEASEKLFDKLLVQDPFRIEGIDVYSAILYVLRKKTKLSKLARRFSGMSRDRPEVCCVIGKPF
jgi:hypothetical protein